ncbi:MAG: formate/nitrite transporter family protein [Tenericutes bacterium]|nr:formate/nitrite transporter family protein [Mycoplasmatota bacterium]
MKNIERRTILKAIAAGVYIGIAGLVYLSLENHIIGSLLFSFGLLVIVNRGYYLYTGKVGYSFPYSKGYLIILLKILLGNMIGIAIVAFLFRLTGISEVVNAGSELFASKIEHTWYETLTLSIFCGMMVYIAVESYKNVKNDLAKVIILIFAVMIFILSKFEHSIVNMLYFSLSDTINLKGILYLLIMIFGNAVGAIFLNSIEMKLNKNIE